MLHDPYYKRKYVIGGLALLIVIVYSIRLFTIQIIDQSTKSKADNNAQLRQTIYPARGLIYDRHGELLVANQPVYDIMMILNEMGSDFDTIRFCQSLHISRAEFDTHMEKMTNRKKNRGFSRYAPQVFMSQLSQQDVATLQQEHYKWPGIELRCRTLRDYIYPIASHVLGNVGEVNQQDLDRDDYYAAGDYSGRDGVEKTYEKELRGEKGVKVLMRDSKGRLQGSYHNGELDAPAKTGNDLQLSLDITCQQLAEQLLSGKVGSVVAIEPQTGEVLVMASSPYWDPGKLVGNARSKNYQLLAADPHKPLMNRATQAQYPPGSTFKTLQALVCQQEGNLKPTTLYPCSGPESAPIKCTHHHGTMVNLEEAIEQSCNPYFWAAFRDLLQQDGYGNDNADFKRHYDTWRNDMMSFGLGSRLNDADIPDQASGSIPSGKLYDKFYGKKGWKAITIRSLSIGQGEILVTPLQLANQAALIANKGWYITPHLNRNDSMKSRLHTTPIQSPYFDVVQRGMARVMTHGTGRWYPIDSITVAGKTGTVENPHGKDHAIFIGFAPVEDPQIAIAVVVENAGFGATWGVPIGSLIIEQYLTGTIRRTGLLERISSTHLIDTEE